jgi:hypothetical protein
MTVLQGVSYVPDLRSVLVSAVKNDGISVSVLLIYHCVTFLQTLTKPVKNLREWASSTKITQKTQIRRHGPQKPTVACRDSVLILPDYASCVHMSPPARFVCACVCVRMRVCVLRSTDDDSTEGIASNGSITGEWCIRKEWIGSNRCLVWGTALAFGWRKWWKSWRWRSGWQI